VCDVSARTVVDLTGNDRARLLHNLCTNDILSLGPGTGCEAFLTSVQGKILGHIFVFCKAQELTVETVPSQAEIICAHLDRYTIREDVHPRDCGSELTKLIVSGRDAKSFLSDLDIQPPSEMYEHRAIRLAGMSATLMKVPLVGDFSYLIHSDGESHARIRQQLLARDIPWCAPEALEIVRIEAGFPLFGVDITTSNLPQEIGRDALAINFKKGCYLGQETVARIDALGHVNRQLRRLEVTGDDPPRAGADIVQENAVVGHVTSCAIPFLRPNALAIGLIRRGVQDTLTIEGRQARVLE
jgi:folate-binding protein YgfZ